MALFCSLVSIIYPTCCVSYNILITFAPPTFLYVPNQVYISMGKLCVFLCLMIPGEKWFCTCFNTGQIVNYHFKRYMYKPSKDKVNRGTSWPWSYGSWIYNYLCNQCLSILMLWVRISTRARCTTLCDKVCQWLATGRLFSAGPLVSSTN
jgi:hypothetical protein